MSAYFNYHFDFKIVILKLNFIHALRNLLNIQYLIPANGTNIYE